MVGAGTAKFGPLSLGAGFPVRIMAVINLSPESFYGGSVATTPGEISARVRRAVEDGADIVDIGGMSTAPYLKSEVPEEVETARVRDALEAIADAKVTISVDTLRSAVAEVALNHGASVINDVSGLKNDPRMAGVVKDHGASLLAMAHSSRLSSSRPILQIRRALKESMRIAESAGIDVQRIALDPGIGFFKDEGAGRAFSPQRLMSWEEWDCDVLANLMTLETLQRPLCIGVSRKSFLGKIAKVKTPAERLSASLAATAIAVMNGADLIRTHDVSETLQAVRVAEAIRRRGPRATRAS
ncbi:MAG: dihydropteroate synthase [Thaumarchaeota archaeon]|nr:dihydropteroate synthase [Nitrososphaerota archaeon]